MNKRALVEHLIRKRELVLTRTMSGRDRFAALKNLERAEKRFLLCFLTSMAGGAYWLAMELCGLNINDLFTLPVHRVVSLVLAACLTVTAALAILGYLSIGLVVERAVEIRPRD